MQSGKRRITLVAPTGAGKTVIFCMIAEAAAKRGSKVLVCVDRIVLLTQALESMKRLGITVTIYQGQNKDLSGQIVVASSQTIKKYLDVLPLADFKLCIIDEAHKTEFDILLSKLPESVRVLGFTATPIIADGKKQKMSDKYDSFYEIETIGNLIDAGFLCKYTHFVGCASFDIKGLSKSRGDFDNNKAAERLMAKELIKHTMTAWLMHGKCKKTLAFAQNIPHANQLQWEFAATGVECRVVHSKIEKKQLEENLEWFKTSKNGVLVNADMLTTGYDQPDIECILLARVTDSLALYMQMIGRGGRILPNKKHFIVIDVPNNHSRMGYWDADRDWEAIWRDGVGKSKNGIHAAPAKVCKECFAVNRLIATECEVCGAAFPKPKQKKVEISNFEVKEVEKKAKSSMFVEIETMAELQGRSRSWVHFRIYTQHGEEGLREYAKEMKYKPYWVNLWLQRHKKNGHGSNKAL